eukprot:144913_1
MSEWERRKYPEVLGTGDFGVFLAASNEIVLLTYNKGIYKYEFKSDDWIKIMDYPDKQCLSNYDATVYINDRNKIIMMSSWSDWQLMECDIQSKQIKILSDNVELPFSDSNQLFCDFDNNIHFTRQPRHAQPTHYIFDKTAKQFKLTDNMPAKIFVNPIPIKFKNSLITTATPAKKTYIMEFTDTKWLIWDYVKGIYYNGDLITTIDDGNRYLIIMAGQDLEQDSIPTMNETSVYDLKKNKLYKTSLTLPWSGRWQRDVVIARNKNHDECLVFGYIKKQLPINVIKMIANYVCFDRIHWICRGKGHLSIDVDKLFQSIQR